VYLNYPISKITELRIPYRSKNSVQEKSLLRNEEMSPLFMAVIEATEEAILNSLFAAQSMKGVNDLKVDALPIRETLGILKMYNKIDEQK